MPPVIAVVAAGASIAGGMAAVGAGSSLLGGMMIAGGVASGLGAITGNKTLSKFGAVLGLAGGIGSIASGAFEGAAGQIAEQSGMDMAADAPSGFAGPEMVSGVDKAADAASGFAGPEMKYGSDMMDPVSKVADATQPQGVINSAQPATTTTPVAADATSPMNATQAANDTATAPAPAAAATPATPAVGTKPMDPAATTANTTTNTGVIQQAVAPGQGGVWDKLKAVPGWIEKNKETAKLGAGLVGGAMASYGQQAAMKQRYALQDEFDQRNRARYSNSIIGLRMPGSKA